MSLRQVILCAVILGLVAGSVVWYLERYERELLHKGFREYLTNYDEFSSWLKEHGRD